MNDQHNLEKDYENLMINYKRMAKMIFSELKVSPNKITDIIEKFKIIFFSKINLSIITKKFLKKIDKTHFAEIKKDAFNDIKIFLIKPLFQLIKFLCKFLLKTESLQSSNKLQLKTIIYGLTHKIVFKMHPKIYETMMLFLNEETRLQNIQLKTQQFSLKKYNFIDSFDVDKDLYLNSQSTNEKIMNGQDLYLNAIVQLNSIVNDFTPLQKLKTISIIHQKIWGSIIKSHDSHNSEIFIELRNKFDTDNLLSIYSYVIFNSKNHFLHQEIAFIEEFLKEDVLNYYEHLFYFENFKSALEYTTNHIKDN